MIAINPWIILGAVVLLALSHSAAFYEGSEMQKGKQAIIDAREATEIEADREKRQKESVKKDYETSKKIRELNAKISTLSRSLTHETISDAYRCKPSTSGLFILNQIRASYGLPAAVSDDKVPANPTNP